MTPDYVSPLLLQALDEPAQKTDDLRATTERRLDAVIGVQVEVALEIAWHPGTDAAFISSETDKRVDRETARSTWAPTEAAASDAAAGYASQPWRASNKQLWNAWAAAGKQTRGGQK